MRRGGIFLAMAVAAGAMATGTWAAAHEGGASATISPASNSSPAGNDIGDDHGGLRPPGVSDDPPGHDANDPDRGLNSGPGSAGDRTDNSGPGSANSGDQDSGDDHGGHDGSGDHDG